MSSISPSRSEFFATALSNFDYHVQRAADHAHWHEEVRGAWATYQLLVGTLWANGGITTGEGSALLLRLRALADLITRRLDRRPLVPS